MIDWSLSSSTNKPLFLLSHSLSYTRVLIEQVETYAQMLSDTRPDKVKQLIHEHENFVKKLGKDWDTQISQVKIGEKIRIEFGRVNSFRNNLQLNIGYGRIIKLL